MAFLRQAQLDSASRAKENPKVYGNPETTVRSQQQPITPKAPVVNTELNVGGGQNVVQGQYDPLGNEYTRSIRNAQGGSGELVTQSKTTGETPQQVDELYGNVQNLSDQRVQDINTAKDIAAQEQGPTIDSQIQELEAQLATPGRGLRQSFGDLLTETQGRIAARKQLNNLLAQKKTADTQAGQSLRAGAAAARTQQNADRNYDLSVRRFKQAERQNDQSSQRKAFEDMRTITTDFAKKEYPDDPVKQQAYVAKQLETATPGFLFNTPEGRITTKAVKESVVDAIKSERGLVDFFLGDKAPDQGDIESLSFKGWKIGDAGPWFGDPTVAQKGQSGNYAYLDNLTDEQVWVLEQLIRRDNPEDYPNQKQESLRTGQ